jgi:ectoine hydroxylase-related dioxygenase (phytanoyl-CoA dioxygenase family)
MSEPEIIQLSEADVQAFQADGAVCLRGLFSNYWLDEIARGIERNLAAPSQYSESLKGDSGTSRFFNDYCNWQQISEFQAYIYHSPAAQIAAQLMGSQQAIIYHEHVLIKEPGNSIRTPWHQDQPYYPIDGQQMCSIWMPLDPVTAESTLLFVKGSHTRENYFVPRKFATAKNYQIKGGQTNVIYDSIPDIDADPDKYPILSWALQPGDCVVFYGTTLHGAAGNASQTTSRRAFSTRWVGEEARFAKRPWEISPPITGGLQPGESLACDTFPLIWPQKSN